jgi:hypothetical protein
MTETNKRIIWQPFALYQPGSDFGIYLDRDFARKMLETKLSLEDRIRVKQLLLEVSESFGFSYPEPANFHEDTAFIKGFYLNDGALLTIDQASLHHLINNPKKELLRYYSEEVNSPKKAQTLMALVDWWVEYADTIKSLTPPAV